MAPPAQTNDTSDSNSADAHDENPITQIIAGAHKLSRRMKAQPLYELANNLREFWFLVLLVVAAIRFPFARPELDIEYRVERLYPPVLLSALYASNEPGSLTDSNDPNGLSAFLNSRDMLRLTIENNASHAIENIDLQIDAFAVTGVAFHSNSSSLMDESSEMSTFEVLDNFAVKFPNVTTIPSKAKVHMLVWGDLETFMWGPPVRIECTTDRIRIREQGLVSGLPLFIGQNVFLLAIIVAVGFLLIGLRRYGRD